MSEKVKKDQILSQLTNTPRKGLYKLMDSQVTDEFNVLVINENDGKVYKADKSVFSGGGEGENTIYTADDSLTGDRVVDANGFDLTFSGSNHFTVNSEKIDLISTERTDIGSTDSMRILTPDHASKEEGSVLVLTDPSSGEVEYFDISSYNRGFLELVQVNTSREFNSTDKNKLLALDQGVILTIPVGEFLEDGDILAVTCAAAEATGFEYVNGGDTILTAYGNNDGGQSETVFLSAMNQGGNTVLLPISTSFVFDTADSKTKTGLRYLKDHMALSGTATLASGTVTVATDKVLTGYKIYVSVNTPSGTQGFLSASTADIIDATSFVINSTSVLDNSTVNWWIAP